MNCPQHVHEEDRHVCTAAAKRRDAGAGCRLWLSQLLLGHQQSMHLTCSRSHSSPTSLTAGGTGKLLNTPTNKHLEQAAFSFSSAVRTPAGTRVLTKEIRCLLVDTQAKLESWVHTRGSASPASSSFNIFSPHLGLMTREILH